MGCSRWDQSRRFISLATGMLIMATSGTVFIYSVYSTDLGDALGFNSKQMSFIGTFAQTVHFLASVPAGAIADRFGGKISSAIGAVLQGLGYSLMALAYRGSFGQTISSHYLFITLYFSLVGMGSSASYAACFSTNVKLFSETQRGAVVGSHSALYSLSSLIFSQINSIFFLRPGEDTTFEFLIALAIITMATNILGVLFLVPTHLPLPEPLPSPVSPPPPPPPFCLNALEESTPGENTPEEKTPGEDSPEESVDAISQENEPLIIKEVDCNSLPLDISGWNLFRQIDFWLMSLLSGLGDACGLMYLNNMTQLIIAITFSVEGTQFPDAQKIANLHISMFSLSSCMAKIAIGIISDFFLRKFHFPRIYFIYLAVIAAILGQLLVALGPSLNLLIFCTLLIGLSYGTLFAILPTVTGDFFGLPSFASNWAFVTLSAAVTSPITNLIFGTIYDNHSFEEGENLVCDGTECFRISFFVTSLLEAVMFCAVLLLHFRRKELWRDTKMVQISS